MQFKVLFCSPSLKKSDHTWFRPSRSDGRTAPSSPLFFLLVALLDSNPRKCGRQLCLKTFMIMIWLLPISELIFTFSSSFAALPCASFVLIISVPKAVPTIWLSRVSVLFFLGWSARFSSGALSGHRASLSVIECHWMSLCNQQIFN